MLLHVTLVLLYVSAARGAELETEEDYYRLVTLPIPDGIVLEVGGIECLPDGRVAVSTRRGDIYFVAGAREYPAKPIQFRRWAAGLHEVLGLSWDGKALVATQRPELTKIRDCNGDGIADEFLTLCDDWEISGDYHEYAFGSDPDGEGNRWVVLCLTGSFSSNVPYRGWCVRVTPDGTMIPTCSGIRSPGGIGMNAVGDVFYTDNQGPWNGTCALKHLKPGSFQGHPGGNRWYSLTKAIGPPPAEPKSGSRLWQEAQRIPQLVPPAVYFPYKKMGQSASGIACDRSGGKFGPFTGQLFVGDQTFSTVMRVYLEQVDGTYQGACFPFRAGFGSGTLALRFAPDGALFVGGTNRGWGSRGSRPFALERLEWTGKTPFEMKEMKALPDGFELVFTQPVASSSAANPKSYSLQTYTYIYQSSYGSPEVDHTTPTITDAVVSADGLSVRLKVDGLQLGHVHELHAKGVKNHAGRPLLHAEAYYTLNALPRVKTASHASAEHPASVSR